MFDELNAKLQTQLQNLRGVVGTDIPSFNQILQQHGLAPVACSAV